MSDRRLVFTLGDVLRENARSLPGREAIVCGEARVDYPELDRRVNRTAHVLAARGVGPGATVAWVGPSCHRTVEALYACAKLGAVLAPLNWRQSDEEMAWTLRQNGPAVVLLWPGFGPSEAAVRDGAGGAQLVTVDATYDDVVAGADDADVCHDTSDELVFLELFTAAFSGRPRGALLTQRAVVVQDLVFAATRQIELFDDVYLASGPMFHVGVLLKLFANLHWGNRSVIVPRVEAEEVCRVIEEERCTSAFLFTPTIGEMVQVAAGGRYDLSSLRTVPGRPPPEAADAWYAMTSCRPPAGAGVTGYGQTETLGMVTFEDLAPGACGVFGRPSPVAAVRVLDEDGAEVATGEVGELAVRGPLLMARYHDEDPSSVPEWHRTHDLGRREADGSVSFLGPKLDLIKTGMENVYPAEVEQVLAAHPAVAAVSVIGVPDPEWGESVRAVVVPADGAAVDEAELITHVRSQIASYKKPKSVVVVDDLPRAGAFVDRAEVKRRWGAP